MEKLSISVHELAGVMGIGRNSAYQLARSAGFPAIRIGRKIVIPIEALKQWLFENGFEQVQI